jgi:glycosyltransferase involved in cell wall biosynthesis
MKAANDVKLNSVKLSVVVASLSSPAALENCLESIFANDPLLLHGVEIIASDCCLKEKTAAYADKYPAVKFIHFPAKTPLPILLGAAIARSKGEIITITDSSCLVAGDWVSSILLAHEAASPVIGGSVEMSGKGNLTTWAAYFCDYARFLPAAPPGIVKVVPGNNLSIKRRFLNEKTGFDGIEFWKTEWCGQLQANGTGLISEPEIRVRSEKDYRLRTFLGGRFHKGRCFAGRRAVHRSISNRFQYAAGSFLLPFVFLFRTLAPVFGKKRFLIKLSLSLPIIVAAVIIWSAGEAIGYLAGAGKSCGRAD